LLACALFVAFAASGVAYALPPAGTDTLNVTGQVSITSRTGQETIALSGTATVLRAAPHSKVSVDAIDAEITSMSLTGTSVTGNVTVAKSASPASNGEIRSLSGSSFPASSFFDVYATVTVPASPNPSVTLHNDTALHVNNPSLVTWPPYNAAYVASPISCILLQPSIQNPAQICISSATFALSAPGVGGLTELPALLEEGERVKSTTPNDHLAGIGVVLVLFVTSGIIANFARTKLRPQR
jgi:hypothetical protein